MSERLAYLAGLFDGEGSFSIQVDMREYNKTKRKNVRFNPRMCMTIKYGSEVLDELVEEFGGTVYYYKNGQNRWNLGSREALIVAAERIYPYLRIKKDICARFLEALYVFPKAKSGASFGGVRAWNKEMVVKVAKIALSLNPPTSRKTSKTGEYVKELVEMYEGEGL